MWCMGRTVLTMPTKADEPHEKRGWDINRLWDSEIMMTHPVVTHNLYDKVSNLKPYVPTEVDKDKCQSVLFMLLKACPWIRWQTFPWQLIWRQEAVVAQTCWRWVAWGRNCWWNTRMISDTLAWIEILAFWAEEQQHHLLDHWGPSTVTRCQPGPEYSSLKTGIIYTKILVGFQHFLLCFVKKCVRMPLLATCLHRYFFRISRHCKTI
jgi:hypothetical protein